MNKISIHESKIKSHYDYKTYKRGDDDAAFFKDRYTN